MKRVALITGITGQVGPYMARFLLDKGYEVYGMMRRVSHEHLDFIKEFGLQKMHLIEGDLSDQSNLMSIVERIQPDEIYNFGAMSHVGTSFAQPELTADVTGVGVLRLLEAIRHHAPRARFYQASSSEMFGDVIDEIQNEKSEFRPQSPYAAAKLYGHHMVRVYREAYNVFACSGIVYNHECFYSQTPIILRKDGLIDIIYIQDLVANRSCISHDSDELSKDYIGSGYEVWDGNSWVELKTVSRKKLKLLDEKDQKRLTIRNKNGCVITTPNHNFIDKNREKLQARDCWNKSLLSGTYPTDIDRTVPHNAFAKFLGLLASDGYVSDDGGVRFINQNETLRQEFLELAIKCGFGYGGKVSKYPSGFGGSTEYIDLKGVSSEHSTYLRSLLYDKKTKHKKVPKIILNSGYSACKAFFEGYYAGDGLKNYKYLSFKSNSPLLVQGLLFILSKFKVLKYTFHLQQQNDKEYFKIDLINTNHKTDPSVVSHIHENEADNQHVFNIETGSGLIMAGVGTNIVCNSPRRSNRFVTKKITSWLGDYTRDPSIEPLELGYIDSRRDWGFAGDYVEGMWLMLQQNEPDDYILCTGETHSVREFCNVAFSRIGIELTWEGQGVDEIGKDQFGNILVRINPEYYRPAEVPLLCGDNSKAKTILNWSPTMPFTELVHTMVDADVGSYYVRT